MRPINRRAPDWAYVSTLSFYAYLTSLDCKRQKICPEGVSVWVEMSSGKEFTLSPPGTVVPSEIGPKHEGAYLLDYVRKVIGHVMELRATGGTSPEFPDSKSLLMAEQIVRDTLLRH